MIIGAHSMIFSKNSDADRAFVRDVLELSSVDVGGGWLIFGLPPAELAVHPSEENDFHELYLMCDDVESFVADMKKRGVPCSPVHEERWGLVTRITLPGGGELGVYEPRHARPKSMPASKVAPKASKASKASKRGGGGRRAPARVPRAKRPIVRRSKKNR
jgi:hypothetical protein